MSQPRLFCSQLPPIPSVHVFHALALISTLIAPASESGSGKELLPKLPNGHKQEVIKSRLKQASLCHGALPRMGSP